MIVVQLTMANLIFSIVLMFCYGTHLFVDGKPTGVNVSSTHEELDSYAIVPSKQKPIQDENFPTNSELALDMVPPAVLKSSSPHIYYMNSDGIAESAETGEIPQRRRRDAPERSAFKGDHNQVGPSSSDETMKTDETIIIRPPGYSAKTLGFRPSRARYTQSRWHKYPWNYH